MFAPLIGSKFVTEPIEECTMMNKIFIQSKKLK